MRELLKQKKRIVVKVGSSTLTHENTESLNFIKLEKLVRILTDLQNQGKEIVLVSSGAIVVGKKALNLKEKPSTKAEKQACAAIGQARLMMVYQKFFSEYNQVSAQVLMTQYTIRDDISRQNAQNTFLELLNMGVIPIVNENDTVSTEEIEFGDNDTLSAYVAALIRADLLILLSDIDGLYTDDPHQNKEAEFIDLVQTIDENLYKMGKGAFYKNGTGGMITKIDAAKIATKAGADMVIANGKDIAVLSKIIAGEKVGTLFLHEK